MAWPCWSGHSAGPRSYKNNPPSLLAVPGTLCSSLPPVPKELKRPFLQISATPISLLFPTADSRVALFGYGKVNTDYNNLCELFTNKVLSQHTGTPAIYCLCIG